MIFTCYDWGWGVGFAFNLPLIDEINDEKKKKKTRFLGCTTIGLKFNFNK